MNWLICKNLSNEQTNLEIYMICRLAVFLLLCTASSLCAQVKLPNMFSDSMVLQREMKTPIFGSAAPGDKITVHFRDQTTTATADKKGNWRVELAPLKAGGPDDLSILLASKPTEPLVIHDVLVGEVWVGSGQSNMAGTAGRYAANDETLAKLLAASPHKNLRLLKSSGQWATADSTNSAAFSALLLAFGAAVQEELDVPVGLMLGAVGGTPSGFWIPVEHYETNKACAAVIEESKKTYPDEAERQRVFDAAIVRWTKLAAKAKATGGRAPRKPRAPVAPGEMTRDGKIGHLYDAHIRPFAGYGIRGVLWDQGEGGTGVQGLDQTTMMNALISAWRTSWKQGEFPFLYVQKPSGGGCAWDLKNPMTRNASAFASLPAKSSDGLYRETHIAISKHPNSWMVSASDLGGGVHPTNKWGYGQRAAHVAMIAAYGKDGVATGPLYRSHEIKGNQVTVSFDNVGKGLAFRHGETLQGFAVAGEDKVFHWADAKIEGDTVVVSSSKVDEPKAVRYAWSQSHPWANLFNKNELPALTFRTDSW